ncbi:hypothetical protein GCM10008938_43150 [Deinococcus roseus]|uniref:Uncharacterized protein n=1 Tax=Deinococcus roseus TaxID=392414 RepID=A0ABQ2DBQ1_9DEIO|nr:hypothetical protein GCM10008938_43150 [Deinococcus roseus]
MLVFLDVNGTHTYKPFTLHSENSIQAQDEALKRIQTQHPNAHLNITCICLQDHPNEHSAQGWFHTWTPHLTQQP